MRKIISLLAFVAFFSFLSVSYANNNYDPDRADDWFVRDQMRMPAPRNKKSLEAYMAEGEEILKKREAAEKVIPRYVMLFSDDNFIYWLDTEALHWRDMPYSALEQVLDTWIKMENIAEDKEYSYPEKYYMEHLYLRPNRRQVMFLSELEVMGKPENNIKERTYKAEYWEDLVPGSVEEEIYKGTLSIIKKLEKKGRVKKREGDSYNFFEDFVGIGGWF
ncbi:MAG: hypothetical protein IKN43_10680 [Selenomonadaceae bacterium]|nr:hypothetical protein [Selenomonadaceae bacterium]